jgi:serine-threonine kinase receptor-associated protein
MEKVVRVFDVERPEADPSQLPGMPSGVRCLNWSRDDGLLFVSFSDSPGIRVYDMRSNVIATTLQTAGPVTSIELSDDGRNITTCDGKTVRLWDAQKLSSVKELAMPCETESASYCNGMVAAGGMDLWVRFFSIHTGQELGETCKGHHGPVHTVRFKPGGNQVASGSEDGTIRIWDAPKDGLGGGM